jgi:hypothetical protein
MSEDAALDLEAAVFMRTHPSEIAQSRKPSNRMLRVAIVSPSA